MSHSPIRKAVIPAAGLGTRVLPATKAIPKPMLPIADKPTIQWVVEEAVAAGIEHVIVVISPGTHAIEEHFEPSPALEEVLRRKGDDATLAMLRHIETMVRMSFVQQPSPKGLGHAVLMARDLVGDEPFGILLADDLVDHPARPCLRQLMDVYDRHGGAVLAVERVPREQVSRYGVVAPAATQQGPQDPRTIAVGGLVEKPAVEDAPSDLAIVGRYVLTPDIFAALAQLAPSRGGEIQLTDGIQALRAQQPIHAYEFEGIRYDVGDPVGLLTTSLAYALRRSDLAPGVRAFLRTLAPDAGA